MRVLITGGTGFVGSHAVRALREAGHQVLLLVRDPALVRKALAPLGLDDAQVEIADGDVLRPETLAPALGRADAVLHAANVYSLNAADAARMQRVNVDGTRHVLHAAAERGLDPIVHVSSTVALLPSDHLTAASPVGRPQGPYLESKAAAERIARELQARGAPVVVTNPPGVYGPHQPHMGESASLVRDILRGRMRLTVRGGFGIVDVRDSAAAHARMFVPGRGPRRYLLGGRYVSIHGLFALLEQVTGRRLPALTLPRGAALAFGRLADAAQRRGIDPGFSYASVWTAVHHPDMDDSETRRELGIAWRPTEDTLYDTVAWLHEQGAVTTRQAGRAAGADWRLSRAPREAPGQLPRAPSD